MRGYLLIELLLALLLVMMSISSFSYYTYYQIQAHSQAIQECRALSLAVYDIEKALMLSTRTGLSYEAGRFLVTRSIRSVEGLDLVQVQVTWKSMSGNTKKVSLSTMMMRR